jgi:hypothetical protein
MRVFIGESEREQSEPEARVLFNKNAGLAVKLPARRGVSSFNELSPTPAENLSARRRSLVKL